MHRGLEPTDFAFEKLQRNLSHNPELASRVTLNQLYLSDGQGLDSESAKTFYSSWSLKKDQKDKHELHCGNAKQATGAKGIALDDFAKNNNLNKIDLIKVDVDGYECKVFRGAMGILKNHNPIVIAELCPYALVENGGSLDELLSIFRECGYEMYEENSFRKISLDVAEVSKMIPKSGSINIVLAKPGRLGRK